MLAFRRFGCISRCLLSSAGKGQTRLLSTSRSTGYQLSSSFTVSHRVENCAMFVSMRGVGSGKAPKSKTEAAKDGEGEEDGKDGVEFEFDPSLSIQKEVAMQHSEKHLESMIAKLIPFPDPPESAVSKLKDYFSKHPIDELIVEPQVQITHVEEAETGKEKRMSLSVCDLSDALESAKAHNMNLVQMGATNNVAFCRIRNEMPRLESLIEEDLKNHQTAAAATGAAQAQPGSAGEGRGQNEKMLELKEHQFRDVVDAHFINWRSKKVVEDMRRHHPVKLTIREFQSPDAALAKLKEMCKAVQTYAAGGNSDTPAFEQKKAPVYHFFTSIVANDRECSITFSPALQGKMNASKIIKHPEEKDWNSAAKRMEDSCRKSGRYGTYYKSAVLKPRAVGSSTYRVDKFGRRIE